jgi:N-methylhydantoinase B
MASQSVEQIEAENPIEITAYEFVPDRCGAGKFRGGAPFIRTYRIKTPEALLQIRADRHTTRPYGLYGGRAGKPGFVALVRQGDKLELGSKVIVGVKQNDEFSYILPGGGGWGDPLDRDPTSVLRDVKNEFISPEAARQDYGLVFDEKTLIGDVAATQSLRHDMRQSRAPVDDFVNWGD